MGSTIQVRREVKTLPAHDDLPVRSVVIVEASFQASQLEVADINDDPELQKEAARLLAQCQKHSTQCPSSLGLTALQGIQLGTRAFADALLVSGGIYFSQKLTEHGTLQANGFVFFAPNPKQGRILSYEIDPFRGGGFLAFGRNGNPTLFRRSEFPYCFEKTPQTSCSKTLDPGHYRLIVESNVILVAPKDGVPKEDENNNKIATSRFALSANSNGSVSLVVAYEAGKAMLSGGLTLREFGYLLVEGGSQFAINLDAGPSAQMEIRGQPSPVKRIEGDAVNTMPQLFVVKK